MTKSKMIEANTATGAPSTQGTANAFALPPLPYSYQQLEPYLSARTLEIHHGKHHARYIGTLNRLISEHSIATTSLEEIVRGSHGESPNALFNNAAQSWNHGFFWESMSSQGWRPQGDLAEEIDNQFGSLERLGQRFVDEGAGHFGSGWVWLVARGRELSVVSTHDAASPIIAEDITPLLVCDVWEHAYYLDYQQDRTEWLNCWWERLANWQLADRQFRAANGDGGAWRFPPASAQTP